MKFCVLLVAALIMAACTVKKKVSADGNEAIVRSMFDAFNRHDWKAMAEHYTDSALFLDPSLGTAYVMQQRADMVAKYAAMQAMFPDIHDEVTGIYPCGDKVIVEFISTGKSDSTSFKLPISSILTLQNGKIVKDATYYDQ